MSSVNTKSVLFVCLGNICRSPMAEGIFREKLLKRGLTVQTDSSGTSSNHVGEAPDKRAIRCLEKYGIAINDLRARQFKPSDFDRFDLIYAMDTSNYSDIIKLAATDEQRRKVVLFLEESFPGKKRSVPDPWFGDEQGFHTVYEMIDATCEDIIHRMMKNGALH